MRTFYRVPLCAFLSVTLSLSPAFMCYAYADESAYIMGVSDVEAQETVQQSDGGGVTGGTSGETSSDESVSSISDGLATGIGYVSDDETAAQTGEDTEEDNGGIDTYGLPLYALDGYSGGSSSDSGPVDASAGAGQGDTDSDIERASGDSGEAGQVTGSSTSDEWPLLSYGDGGNDDSFGGFAGDDFSADSGIMPRSLTEVGYLDKIYFALGASSMSSTSEQIVIGSYKWQALKYSLYWVVSWMLQCVQRIDVAVASINTNSNRANNYLQAIDSATKYHRSEFTGAWGYGYGGTVVFNSNSPAGWLKFLYQNSYTTHTFPGASDQTTEGFAEILWRISYLLYDQSGGRSVGNTLGSVLSDMCKQWGYGYGGTRVIEVNSPAYWLEWLYKYSWTTHTFAGESSSSTKGVAEILWRMDSKLWDSNRSRSVGNIAGDLLAALQAVNDRDARSNAWGYDYGTKKNYYEDSPAGWLEWLYKYSWATHTFAGDTSKTTKGFAEILWLIDSKLWDINRGRSVGNLLGDVLTVLVGDSRLLSDWLMAWDSYRDGVFTRLDALKGGISADIDLGYIEAKLDTIATLMTAGAAKDIVDTLVGELDFSTLSALSSDVESAISSVFPFCIPAVLKQVLGLVRADAAAPAWDFEIGGEVMHVDFSPMQPLADVSGWFCRVAFLVVLLANTRRFVFMGGGAVE